MRIQRIDLDGFGRLEDFSEQLAEGLHVFYGPNEAGKSTLQRAILALLYGFYETDRSRPSERAAQEHDEPWSGAPYRGRLEYELADGRRFRVDRDFSTADVATRIHELSAGGRDVTDDYGRGRHGNLRLAIDHLGMPKAVFEACAFVSQDEVFEVQERAKDIGDSIIRLADSAGREVSAQDALDRLDKVYKEDVGSKRARTTPLPVAQGRLEDLEREIGQIDAVRSQISEDATARDEAQRRAEGLRSELRRARYLLALAHVDETRRTLDQLNDLTRGEEDARTALEEHEAYASFPFEERDYVQSEWTRIQQTKERLANEREAVENQSHSIEKLASQHEGLAREQHGLAHLRDFPVQRRPNVDRLHAEWRASRTRANDARASLDAIANVQDRLAQYEALEERVGCLSETDVRRLYERLSAREQGGPLAAIVTFFSAIVRLVKRLFGGRQTSDESQSMMATSRAEAEQLLADRERWNALRPRVERYRDGRVALGTADGTLRSAEQALLDALRGAVDHTADLQGAYQVFVQRCDGAARLQQLDNQVAAIDREMETLSNVVRRFEQDERQVQANSIGLRNRLQELTKRDGSLEELLGTFDEGCRRRRAYDEHARHLAETRQQRGILLGGRSPEELRRVLEEHEREAVGILAAVPSLQGATTHEPPRELSQRVEQMEDDLHAAELRIERVTTRIDTELEKLRPRAEVEEEVERTRREAEMLERFRDELQIAMDVITEAAEEAHRDFAPHVGRFLSGHIAHVTGGRYSDMHLDPTTLELRVEVPETRRLEEIGKLSRGTRAAAYLLLRVGLAQHMSSMHEPVPLILDDPLVELDGARKEHFLNLLLQLASDVQIVLFTKDKAIRTWFEQHCREDAFHGLTLLQPPLEQATLPEPPQPQSAQRSLPEPSHVPTEALPGSQTSNGHDEPP